MKVNSIIRNLLIIIIVITNIGCDQVSKNIVRQKVVTNQQISVLDKYVILTKVENTGAFLSFGDHMSRISYWIMMIVLPLIVLGYALYYLFTAIDLSKVLIVSISLIVGGGLGNIIDRVLYGSVTDFLHFDFVLFHTGIVNLADISLTTGFFILFYVLIVDRKSLNQGALNEKFS
jgi:signal peptidase II